MWNYLVKEIKSFKYAFKGIVLMGKDHNSYIHIPAAILVIGLGFYFDVNKNEWLWLILAIALVWVTETVNTAIEKLVDLVSPEHNELAGKVKDIAAGAVLLGLMFSTVIGAIVLYPYLKALVGM